MPEAKNKGVAFVRPYCTERLSNQLTTMWSTRGQYVVTCEMQMWRLLFSNYLHRGSKNNMADSREQS